MMKNLASFILVSYCFISQNILKAQDIYKPSQNEVEKLDSLVMRMFKETDLYSKNETYYVTHVYEYKMKSGLLNRSTFLANNIFDSLQKCKILIIKQWPDYKYKYKLARSLEKYSDDNKVLKVYCSWIYTKCNLKAKWVTGDLILFDKEQKPDELWKIFKLRKYSMMFRICNSAGGACFGVRKDNVIEAILINNKEGDSLYEIMSIKSLLDKNWYRFDLFGDDEKYKNKYK